MISKLMAKSLIISYQYVMKHLDQRVYYLILNCLLIYYYHLFTYQLSVIQYCVCAYCLVGVVFGDVLVVFSVVEIFHLV